MPTALDAGRYSSNGRCDSDQRQYVRAIGLPDASTCASAARNAGVIVAVECLRKTDSYVSQVSSGSLYSTPLTGKNSSEGLRTTW